MPVPVQGPGDGVFIEVELANNGDVLTATTVRLASEQVRRLRTRAVVDTTGMRPVLPRGVAEQLGLPASTWDAALATDLWLRLQGRDGVYSAHVAAEGTHVRIGWIVLQDLDFVVDPATGTLRPRDPRFIVTEIE